jgi:hypothetical protein
MLDVGLYGKIKAASSSIIFKTGFCLAGASSIKLFTDIINSVQY